MQQTPDNLRRKPQYPYSANQSREGNRMPTYYQDCYATDDEVKAECRQKNAKYPLQATTTDFGRLFSGNTSFCPITVTHCLLQETKIFHSRRLITVHQVDFRQTLDSSCPGVVRRKNHSQNGGMFSHRHISQRKPDFIGCINSEVGRMGSHGQKQPLRSRLITIHQPVGKSVLLCIQQIIIIGSERPKYISESNAKRYSRPKSGILYHRDDQSPQPNSQ